jgi:hypothetical protein
VNMSETTLKAAGASLVSAEASFVSAKAVLPFAMALSNKISMIQSVEKTQLDNTSSLFYSIFSQLFS